ALRVLDHPLHVPDDDVGRQVRAVMELDVRLELQRERVARQLPGLRESPLDAVDTLVVRRPGEQRVEDGCRRWSRGVDRVHRDEIVDLDDAELAATLWRSGRCWLGGGRSGGWCRCGGGSLGGR